ncbi:MAG: hypothetical protein WAU36_07940 [Cyclobacteriaceae bacterium]
MTLDNLLILRMLQFSVLIIGVFLGFKSWKVLSTPLKLLSVYILLLALLELGTYGMFKSGMNPNLLGSVFQFIDTIIILYFYTLILDSKKITKILFLAVFFLIIFYGFNLAFIQKDNHINSYSIILHLSAMLILGLYYVFRLLKEPPNEKITKLPIFWINVGNIIKASGTLFLYILSDYLIYVLNNDMIAFTSLIYIVQFFVYAFFIYAIWMEGIGEKIKAK